MNETLNQVLKPYERFQSQGHVKMAYRCSKFNAYCLLSCRDNSTLIFCLCQPTVTLHQGQGHRNEYEHIIMSCISTVVPSLNAIT